MNKEVTFKDAVAWAVRMGMAKYPPPGPTISVESIKKRHLKAGIVFRGPRKPSLRPPSSAQQRQGAGVRDLAPQGAESIISSSHPNNTTPTL